MVSDRREAKESSMVASGSSKAVEMNSSGNFHNKSLERKVQRRSESTFRSPGLGSNQKFAIRVTPSMAVKDLKRNLFESSMNHRSFNSQDKHTYISRRQGEAESISEDCSSTSAKPSTPSIVERVSSSTGSSIAQPKHITNLTEKKDCILVPRFNFKRSQMEIKTRLEKFINSNLNSTLKIASPSNVDITPKGGIKTQANKQAERSFKSPKRNIAASQEFSTKRCNDSKNVSINDNKSVTIASEVEERSVTNSLGDRNLFLSCLAPQMTQSRDNMSANFEKQTAQKHKSIIPYMSAASRCEHLANIIGEKRFSSPNKKLKSDLRLKEGMSEDLSFVSANDKSQHNPRVASPVPLIEQRNSPQSLNHLYQVRIGSEDNHYSTPQLLKLGKDKNSHKLSSPRLGSPLMSRGKKIDFVGIIGTSNIGTSSIEEVPEIVEKSNNKSSIYKTVSMIKKTLEANTRPSLQKPKKVSSIIKNISSPTNAKR